MLWRLFVLPLITALVLLVVSLLLIERSNQKSIADSQEIDRQWKEILQLQMENRYLRAKRSVQGRYHQYIQSHEEIRSRLNDGESVNLYAWKSELADKLGFPVDIYLISPDYVIEETTFSADLGLDFKQPFFKDAQLLLSAANKTGLVQLGEPTREITTGQFKVYTISSLDDGRYLELGLSDPKIAELFNSVRTGMESIDNVRSVELYLDIWGSMLNPLAQLRTGSLQFDEAVDKTETINRINAYLKEEALQFEGVDADTIQVVSGGEESATQTYYMELYRVALAPEVIFRVLAKVEASNEQPSWLQESIDELSFFVLAVALLVLLFGYVEIRNRLLSPLRSLSHSMANNDCLSLIDTKKIPFELQLLVECYNDYRSRNEELASELKLKSVTDELTKLSNRTTLPVVYSQIQRTLRREDKKLAALFVDIDHFKGYNDTYGHTAGDLALKSFSDVLREVFRRPTDAAIRYGGEEFLVFFGADDIESAEALAEKLRSTLQKRGIENAVNQPYGVLTVSIGLVVSEPDDSVDMGDIISAADEELYKAKDNGRNRVCSLSMVRSERPKVQSLETAEVSVIS